MKINIIMTGYLKLKFKHSTVTEAAQQNQLRRLCTFFFLGCTQEQKQKLR